MRLVACLAAAALACLATVAYCTETDATSLASTEVEEKTTEGKGVLLPGEVTDPADYAEEELEGGDEEEEEEEEVGVGLGAEESDLGQADETLNNQFVGGRRKGRQKLFHSHKKLTLAAMNTSEIDQN